MNVNPVACVGLDDFDVTPCRRQQSLEENQKNKVLALLML